MEFGDKVSFLLLLPPSDEVCTAPGQNNPYSPRSGFLTLPLQIFELGQCIKFHTLSELRSLKTFCCFCRGLTVRTLFKNFTGFLFLQSTLTHITPVSSASTVEFRLCWSWSPSCHSRRYERPSLKLSSLLLRRNTNRSRSTCRYDY